MLDVVIVGAGAAGLSAALTAHNQGLSYVVLEQRKLANTIVNMPKRKRVLIRLCNCLSGASCGSATLRERSCW